MTPERLASMLSNGVAVDFETHRIQPGLPAPPIVCGSVAQWLDGKPQGFLCGARATGRDRKYPDVRDVFESLLRDRSVVVTGAHIAFDLLCLAVDRAAMGRDILQLIFDAFEDGRIFDVQHAQALHAIGIGMLGKDPVTGGPLRTTEGKVTKGYSLETCVRLRLGRSDAKVNDRFRQSFYLLEGIPIEQWPPEAQIYPVDDVCNTHECALAQAGLIPAPATHQYPDHGSQRCIHCGAGVFDTTPCKPRLDRYLNLHDLANQTYAYWSMYIGGCWGFVVDQAAADAVEERVEKSRAGKSQQFLDGGIMKWVRKDGAMQLGRDMGAIKKRVAVAYGCTGSCAECQGSGKILSTRAKQVRCTACRSARSAAAKLGDVDSVSCEHCGSTGKRWGSGSFINCKPCSATGLDITSAAVPLTTPKNPDAVPGVGTGRDALDESGDDFLSAFADYMREAKIPQVYLPWLRSARIPVDVPVEVLDVRALDDLLDADDEDSEGEDE